MSYLGEMLKEMREKRKMSLQDVANIAHISKAHIWDLEQGAAANPSIETVCKLARALKLDPILICSAAIVDHGMAIPVTRKLLTSA